MKENEFDIYVRDLLSGAEESVSPKVWKGIEAGLDKAARPRVVPMWIWRSVAGVAAAAAVVAGILLVTPDKNLSNQPTIQNPVAEATDATLPAETRPEEDGVLPIAQQAASLNRRTAYVQEIAAETERQEEETAAAEVSAPDEEPEVRKPESVISPAARQESYTSDEEAFNRIAFEEHKVREKGRFSMGLLGNVQSNTRPESPVSTMRRTTGIFLVPTPAQTGIYDERPEFSFGLPVSGGLSFRYDFNRRWGIGTGIQYTNLSRSFMASYAEVEDGTVLKNIFDTDVTNQQHYIGIPLNLYFNIVNSGNWNVHALIGGTAEKLVKNHFLIHDSEGDIHYTQNVDPLQLSAGIGVGIEFRFSPRVGIYFDPTLRYYFDSGQPRSIRTVQPLRMDFEAGLRFSLGQ